MSEAKRHRARNFLIASRALPGARQLASVASERHWRVYALDEPLPSRIVGWRTFYGGTDRAGECAAHFGLCLIEPPLDLLARVPTELLARTVRYGTLAKVSNVRGPVFVKPADPVLKSFDAGVYRSVGDVRGRSPLDPRTPTLVSEPVEWTSEFRCFMREGKVEAWSPYLSFGRPTWKPQCAGETPESLISFCGRLRDAMGGALPPAFVVDVGVLASGRWAVVEFNPVWCSGILGAEPEKVLKVLERAAFPRSEVSADDLRWFRLGVAD
jgi:hypothetical protein